MNAAVAEGTIVAKPGSRVRHLVGPPRRWGADTPDVVASCGLVLRVVAEEVDQADPVNCTGCLRAAGR